MVNPPTSAKDLAAAIARIALDAFLASGRALDFRPRQAPKISILILLCNRAEITLSCLQSLALGYNETPYELILVDNGSTDRTAALLDRIEGATVLRNAANRGFPAGVNQAAELAVGEYLLLLNNDTEVLGRSIDTAADCLDRNPDIGMVGGKVVLLDGTLQEAGCGLWQNGWSYQYARGTAPDDPSAAFERDVDYCSAAFLMTRRAAFNALGGFDEIFSPGYFEDVDLSLRFRRLGWRVRYLPDIVLLHYENATSATLVGVLELAQRNHRTFFARHADWLAEQPDSARRENLLLARRADDTALNVLYVPEGFANLGPFVRTLEALDVLVTVGFPNGAIGRESVPRTAEVVSLNSMEDFERLLADRPGYFDLALFDTEPAPQLAAVLLARGVRWAIRRGNQFQFARGTVAS